MQKPNGSTNAHHSRMPNGNIYVLAQLGLLYDIVALNDGLSSQRYRTTHTHTHCNLMTFKTYFRFGKIILKK